MDFTEYSRKACLQAKYPSVAYNLVHPALGLNLGVLGCSIAVYEALLNTERGTVDWDRLRPSLRKALGQTLLWVASMANEAQIPLQELADESLKV